MGDRKSAIANNSVFVIVLLCPLFECIVAFVDIYDHPNGDDHDWILNSGW